jgi:hypothetical protein
MELDASSMEKRFAYKFLKKILKYVDSAQEFIAHLGKYHWKAARKNLIFLYQGMILSYYTVHNLFRHRILGSGEGVTETFFLT